MRTPAHQWSLLVTSQHNLADATDEALTRCRRTEKTPLTALHDFVEELRAQGWSEAEINQLEAAVRRRLAGNR
jgi:hypothetical protein